ncbi:unnamed protein product [Oppiella nova]|uniref:Uncharacterized protein n=1 Tax=Oppiella nova TaxID=334625 RepID=A0A7R9MNY4_9ACAR|nr:unnamed protein product [Oppiella nova]CAG2179656.1 unnamed protein product [Oppiella nova]
MSKFTFGSYNIRPAPENKFKANDVKKHIKYKLNEELRDKEYNEKELPILTNHLTSVLLQYLKDLNLEKYKFMVSVIIAEQRGQGLKMTSECYWDSDTDYYVTETIVTDSLRCDIFK